MDIKLKEDIKPLSQFRINPNSVIQQIKKNQRPVVITDRGKPSVILVDLDEYERQQEKMDLMEAILDGERDVESGRTQSVDKLYKQTRVWLQEKK